MGQLCPQQVTQASEETVSQHKQLQESALPKKEKKMWVMQLMNAAEKWSNFRVMNAGKTSATTEIAYKRNSVCQITLLNEQPLNARDDSVC